MTLNKFQRQYRAQPGLASLNKTRPIPLSNHRPLKFIRDKTKPFQYVVEVQTRDRRSGLLGNYYITVIDNKSVAPNDIMQDAASAIMNSPVASKEELVGTRLISARRFKV